MLNIKAKIDNGKIIHNHTFKYSDNRALLFLLLISVGYSFFYIISFAGISSITKYSGNVLKHVASIDWRHAIPYNYNAMPAIPIRKEAAASLESNFVLLDWSQSVVLINDLFPAFAAEINQDMNMIATVLGTPLKTYFVVGPEMTGRLLTIYFPRGIQISVDLYNQKPHYHVHQNAIIKQIKQVVVKNFKKDLAQYQLSRAVLNEIEKAAQACGTNVNQYIVLLYSTVNPFQHSTTYSWFCVSGVKNHCVVKTIYRYHDKISSARIFNRNGIGVYTSTKTSKSSLLVPLLGKYRTSGSYGERRKRSRGGYRMHTGIDYAATYGTPIVAAIDGVVMHAAIQPYGYGRHVIVDHGSGYKTLYAHMSRYKPGLKVGTKVTKGQVIGFVGNSGFSKGAHLHFECIIGNKKVKPHVWTSGGAAQYQLSKINMKKFIIRRNIADGIIASTVKKMRITNKAEAL